MGDFFQKRGWILRAFDDSARALTRQKGGIGATPS
jgi:hypothetical protein